MNRKFKIITLGCKVNQYESQAYFDQLTTLGFKKANDEENCDICIINGCSVTENAEKKTLFQIKSLKKKNFKTKFFITGCFGDKIKSFLENNSSSENFIVIPNRDKDKLVSYLFPDRIVPCFSIKNFEDHTRAFVKIQDGCKSGCTYCIIPKTRGPSKSRNFNDIKNEVIRLVDEGYKEIVLTGINIGQYNFENISFVQVLKELEKIEDLKRIKISSIDPEHITDDFIKTLKNSKKIIKSLHLVLQSGSDRILKLMNRKYNSKKYIINIKKLEKNIPDITFTTDIIVGFPSESEKDFSMTLEMVDFVKFIKVHIFPFSPRPNTLAYNFKNKVDREIILKRKKILEENALKNAFEKQKIYLSKKMEVLFESDIKDFHTGHTSNNLLVYVPKNEEEKIEKNNLREVNLIKNRKNYILGKL